MDKTRHAERLRIRLASNTDRQRRAEFHRTQLADKVSFLKEEAKKLREEIAQVSK